MTEMLMIECDIHVDRKGRGSRKVLANGPKPYRLTEAGRVPRIARLLALAIRFEQLLREGVFESYTELAALGHVTRARISQIMNLLNLAPDIQKAILFLPRTLRGRDSIILARPATDRRHPRLAKTAAAVAATAGHYRLPRHAPQGLSSSASQRRAAVWQLPAWPTFRAALAASLLVPDPSITLTCRARRPSRGQQRRGWCRPPSGSSQTTDWPQRGGSGRGFAAEPAEIPLTLRSNAPTARLAHRPDLRARPCQRLHPLCSNQRATRTACGCGTEATPWELSMRIGCRLCWRVAASSRQSSYLAWCVAACGEACDPSCAGAT
jgi:hypothetical protein